MTRVDGLTSPWRIILSLLDLLQCLGGGLADLLGLRLVVPQEPHDGIDVPHGMVFCQPLGGMQLLLIVSESKPVQVPLLANPVLRCKPNSEEDNDAYGG